MLSMSSPRTVCNECPKRYLPQLPLKSGHSKRMCSTLRRLANRWHIGGGSRRRRWPWLIWQWPIRKRVSITSSLRREHDYDFHSLMTSFTFLSLYGDDWWVPYRLPAFKNCTFDEALSVDCGHQRNITFWVYRYHLLLPGRLVHYPVSSHDQGPNWYFFIKRRSMRNCTCMFRASVL